MSVISSREVHRELAAVILFLEAYFRKNGPDDARSYIAIAAEQGVRAGCGPSRPEPRVPSVGFSPLGT
jgi:hypothetical protein